jgi:LmbE family N-acetylglucosaminyl deacetylase
MSELIAKLAAEIADKANECCSRSDGYEEAIEAQAKAALEEVRRKALEEAAAICDRFQERKMAPAECAGAIRAAVRKTD